MFFFIISAPIVLQFFVFPFGFAEIGNKQRLEIVDKMIAFTCGHLNKSYEVGHFYHSISLSLEMDYMIRHLVVKEHEKEILANLPEAEKILGKKEFDEKYAKIEALFSTEPCNNYIDEFNEEEGKINYLVQLTLGSKLGIDAPRMRELLKEGPKNAEQIENQKEKMEKSTEEEKAKLEAFCSHQKENHPLASGKHH